MFMGEYAHAIDDKGRLTIPARFRDSLGQGAVVTRGFDKNLILYTAEAFRNLSTRTRALSPTDPTHRALLRMAFSSASEAEPDKQGRILIPPFLREYAELVDECVVVGVGDYIEVWGRAAWVAQLETINDPALNAQRFAGMNLAIDTPAG